MDLVKITFLLISIGSLFMLLGVFKTRRLLQLVIKSKELTLWKTLFILMIFFLGGYLTSLYLLTSGKKEILILLTGLVFLFGAFFVYIVVRVSCRTIDSLLTKDRTEELNLKLRDNIRELEFANKQLESFSYSVSHVVAIHMNTKLEPIVGVIP